MVTLGPLAESPAPGTTPKLAFQRARLSSSASSFAYSSKLLAAPSLNPVELSVRSCPSLVANGDYGTWGGGWDQLVVMWGLNRGVISPPNVCFRVGGNVHSCLGSGWSLTVVIFSGRGCHWSPDSETGHDGLLSLLFIDNGNYRTVTWAQQIHADLSQGWQMLLCPTGDQDHAATVEIHLRQTNAFNELVYNIGATKRAHKNTP